MRRIAPFMLAGVIAASAAAQIDAQLIARRGRTTATIEYADYDAASFATNTKKLWLSLDWSL